MNELKIFLKIFLIVVGVLMLVGGGLCAAIDLMLMGPNGFSGSLSGIGGLLLISIVVAGVGFLLLKLAFAWKILNYSGQDASEAANKDANEIKK